MESFNNRSELCGLNRNLSLLPDQASDGQETFRAQIEAANDLVQTLADKLAELSITADSRSGGDPAVELGIDFYAEIRRFEIALIKRALKLTNGSQKKAATLLHLRQTTLNTKIKQYSLGGTREYRRAERTLSATR
jgi:DNA-binding NtrC family response regulator